MRSRDRVHCQHPQKDPSRFIVEMDRADRAAIEAVIKGREAAYVRIDGMALEHFIHGPMICLQQNTRWCWST